MLKKNKNKPQPIREALNLTPGPKSVPREQPDTIIDEEQASEIIQKETLTRYRVRNLLFRIRDNRVEKKDFYLAEALKGLIQAQLKDGEYLYDFTFKWDVNPHRPLQVIHKEDWYKIKRERYPNLYKRAVFNEQIREYELVDMAEKDKENVDRTVSVEEENTLFSRQR